MSYLEVQYGPERQPHSRFPAKLVAYLVKRGHVQPSDMLLELGCGRGDFLEAWFRQLCGGAAGVDREVMSSRAYVAKADLAIDRLPFQDGIFDVVFSKSLIEHLQDPTNMLVETRRVLASGGRIIVMTPDWRTYMRTFYDDYTHVRPYDQVSLADLLTANGFVDVSCTRIYQYPLLWRLTPLRLVAILWRCLVPIEFSLWLSRATGCGFFRWSSQLTLLAVARRGRAGIAEPGT